MVQLGEMEDMLFPLDLPNKSHACRLGARIQFQPYRLDVTILPINKPDNKRNQPMYPGSPLLEQLSRPCRMAGHQRPTVFGQHKHAAYAALRFRG